MKDNWTEDFFNKMYWSLFMKRTPEQVEKEVAIINTLLEGKKINNLLDVCCGVADIARQLELTYNIPATGIEYSSDYIKESFIKNIIQGDACEIQTDKKFSVVINWYSSFAYFNPEKNKKLIENCAAYCDDVFLLESYNPYAVIYGFKESFKYQKDYEGTQYQVDRNCSIDISKRMLIQKWNFKSRTSNYSYDTQSYLYFPDEIKALLLEVGFKQVEILGRDNDKIVSLDIHTPRMIIRAYK